MADIIICAENPLTRAGLTAMAATSSNQVVAQLRDVLTLSTWLQTRRADLAIVELSSASESDLTELISRVVSLVVSLAEDGSDGGVEAENMPLLFMIDSEHELSEKSIQQLVTELLNTGLVSILPVTVSSHQMRDAIAAILNGLVILHPDITEALFAANETSFVSAKPAAYTDLEPLTAREIQVLNHLASGLTNKAIAKAFNISEHTVKFHVSAIFSKLNVSSRTEAVGVGIRTGLVML
jgi:two-component system, NarL family, response regulator YdfI